MYAIPCLPVVNCISMLCNLSSASLCCLGDEIVYGSCIIRSSLSAAAFSSRTSRSANLRMSLCKTEFGVFIVSYIGLYTTAHSFLDTTIFSCSPVHSFKISTSTSCGYHMVMRPILMLQGVPSSLRTGTTATYPSVNSAIARSCINTRPVWSMLASIFSALSSLDPLTES